jgi:hypothetical protein
MVTLGSLDFLKILSPKTFASFGSQVPKVFLELSFGTPIVDPIAQNKQNLKKKI